jgi:REP element-mobilizing transposase RayT
VWTTKHRTPLITPDVEALLFPSIAHRARELEAIVYALDGVEDHVHLVAAVPPRIAIAQFVGELKGRSSFIVGHKLELPFAWQAGYGVHTFGEKHLGRVIRYVECQKEHHSLRTLYPALEAALEDDDGPPGVIPTRAIDGPSEE